jgi:hypothetical protein
MIQSFNNYNVERPFIYKAYFKQDALYVCDISINYTQDDEENHAIILEPLFTGNPLSLPKLWETLVC